MSNRKPRENGTEKLSFIQHVIILPGVFNLRCRPVPPDPNSNGIRLEIKCTTNVLYFNYPKTYPHPQSMENVSSMKPVPGAKKAGDHFPIPSWKMKLLHL